MRATSPRFSIPVDFQWIVDPHSVSPKTAMPVTGISIDDARDVAAFLYTR
jgi:cytochrome c1